MLHVACLTCYLAQEVSQVVYNYWYEENEEGTIPVPDPGGISAESDTDAAPASTASILQVDEEKRRRKDEDADISSSSKEGQTQTTQEEVVAVETNTEVMSSCELLLTTSGTVTPSSGIEEDFVECADGSITSVDDSSNPEVTDTDDIFSQLFQSTGQINTPYIQEVLINADPNTLRKLLLSKDVDGLNLLHKALVYQDMDLLALAVEILDVSTQFDLLQGVFHMASFLGYGELVSLILRRSDEVIQTRGCITLGPVMGPPGHLLEKLGYSTPTSPSPTVLVRRHWVEKHRSELPISYAVCGNQPEILDRLLPYHRHMDTGENFDNLLSELMDIACCCGSSACLELLSNLSPDGLYRRHASGASVLNGGFAHGPAFLDVLLDMGLDVDFLNCLDSRKGTNALHVYYDSLGHKNMTISKFRNLMKMTQLLVEVGVDLEQETAPAPGSDIGDTPLHLLLDQLNLVIRCLYENYPSIPRKWRDMQFYWDSSAVQAVEYILQSGYCTHEYSNSLLNRLFSNRHIVTRFELHNKGFAELSKRSFGLQNTQEVLHLLIDHGATWDVDELSRTTPLNRLVSLLMYPAVWEGLHTEGVSPTIINCCRMLILNGCPPFVDGKRLYDKEDMSSVCDVQIQLVDVFVQMWYNQANHSVADLKRLNLLQELSQLFCHYGARLKCSVILGSNCKRVTHHALDSVLGILTQLSRQPDADTINSGVTLMKTLLISLLPWGADPTLAEYAYECLEFTTKTPFRPNSTRNHLLYQVVQLFKSDNLVSKGDVKDKLFDIMHMLRNVSDQKVINTCSNHFQGNLNGSTSGAALHQVVLQLTKLTSLRALCRRTLHAQLRNGYRRKIDVLPIPRLIKDYLITFSVN